MVQNKSFKYGGKQANGYTVALLGSFVQELELLSADRLFQQNVFCVNTQGKKKKKKEVTSSNMPLSSRMRKILFWHGTNYRQEICSRIGEWSKNVKKKKFDLTWVHKSDTGETLHMTDALQPYNCNVL